MRYWELAGPTVQEKYSREGWLKRKAEEAIRELVAEKLAEPPPAEPADPITREEFARLIKVNVDYLRAKMRKKGAPEHICERGRYKEHVWSYDELRSWALTVWPWKEQLLPQDYQAAEISSSKPTTKCPTRAQSAE